MASLNTAVAEQQPVNSKFRVLTASLVGTTIEFFDFYIYATAAVIIFPYQARLPSGAFSVASNTAPDHSPPKPSP